VGAALLLLAAGCEKRPAPAPPPPPAVEESAPARVETLADAAARGNLATVRRLLANGANPAESDTERLTPLHHAALGGHVYVLQALIDAGAPVDAQDQYGFTALHSAARDGHETAVRYLVSRGADLTLTEQSGKTAEQLARFIGHAAIADYLASRVAPPPVEEPVVAEEPPPPVVLLTGETFRVWSSLSGAQVQAEFVQSVFDTVTLRKNDGALVRIALSQLIPADQTLVRELSGAAAPVLNRSRAGAARPAFSEADSLGLRAGRGNGWVVLENCQLLRRSGNDGDSFHVKHDGKEYIFRLYYVDTPETNDAYPDRVKDQADYFGVEPDDVIRIGHEAARFTEKLLSRGPFLVATQWEDARGNSKLPRHYAFVVTPEGDLDELLIAEGLVRLYGMKVDGSAAGRKYSALKKLEEAARRDRLGGWGLKNRATAEAK
jgi:endonuclease YncB( thermonuclease family)